MRQPIRLSALGAAMAALGVIVALVLVLEPQGPETAEATDTKVELDFIILGGAPWNEAQVTAQIAGADAVFRNALSPITLNWPKQTSQPPAGRLKNIADPQLTPGVAGDVKVPAVGPHGDFLADDKTPTEAEVVCDRARAVANPKQFPVVLIRSFVDLNSTETTALGFAVRDGPKQPGKCVLLSTRVLQLPAGPANLIVLAHELAHALCLDHLDVPNTLMRPTKNANNTQLNQSQRDQLCPKELGTAAPPLCAAQANPAMCLSVKNGPTCDAIPDPTECTAGVGQQFTLVVEATGIPGGGYLGFQTEVLLGGLVWKKAAVCQQEVVWPDILAAGVCIAGNGPGGEARHFAGPGFPLPLPSAFIGGLVQLTVDCPAPGSHKVTLTAVPNSLAGAAFIDPLAVQVTVKTQPQNGNPVADTLTINCVLPPTPTPTATPTATATPNVPPPTAPPPLGGSGLFPEVPGAGGSSMPIALVTGIAVAIAAGATTFAGAAWYARRRWL